MYVPEDRLLWDFWVILSRGYYHLFYLQAPRDLRDPEMRHSRAVVGLAVSQDLENWEYQGTVLRPGSRGTWDDRAIWTGSVVEWEDRFYMLYTGTQLADDGRMERIGLACSEDLRHWDKHPGNPVIEADLEQYEEASDSMFSETAWRDPYLIHEKSKGIFYALITARLAVGGARNRGCLALAQSQDMKSWEVREPVQAPCGFAQMEVPQCVVHEGYVYLLFSADSAWRTKQWKKKGLGNVTGTYYMTSRSIAGPYSEPRLLVGDKIGSRYGSKLLQRPDGQWVVLSWMGYDNDGKFVGGLSDPMPAQISGETIRLA